MSKEAMSEELMKFSSIKLRFRIAELLAVNFN